MPVMTRKATVQELELKLRTALQKLQASDSKCQQLLLEIDESEKEVEKVIYRNTSLKQELVDLHQQYLDVVDERDKLRVVTDGFNNCSNLYEEALCKVRDLEDELIQANVQITKLQKQKECTQAQETNNLYNELFKTNCNPDSLVTIDLTEDSILKQNNSRYKVSLNKIKKYAKLNKIIRKCKQFRKQQKHCSYNIKLRKERVFLINKLNNYQIKLEDSKNIYEIDTQRLQSEIQVLEESIHSLYTKYVRSEKQIQEHILAANELVDMCNSNAITVDPLTVSNPQCSLQRKSSLVTFQPEATEDPSQSGSALVFIPNQDSPDTVRSPLQVVQTPIPSVPQPVGSSMEDINNSRNNLINTTYVFSDKFGQGFGSLFNQCSQQYVINNCLPGASVSQLISKIKLSKINPSSTVILLYGDSLTVRKKDIIECVHLMLHLNETNNCKFIFCALPYSKYLSDEQNRHIYNLNMLIYNRTCHHSDAILYFDCNQFITDYKLTNYTMYLPPSCRRLIANLLAYNIHSDTGTCSVPSITVSSGTNTTFDTPCSLNY